jgi:hypothetical protein
MLKCAELCHKFLSSLVIPIGKFLLANAASYPGRYYE